MSIQCIRWRLTVKDRSDCAESLTEVQVNALPQHIQELYEECGGEVAYHYAYDPGCYRDANGDGYPPSEEFEPYACDTCKADNWSEAEEQDLFERLRDA